MTILRSKHSWIILTLMGIILVLAFTKAASAETPDQQVYQRLLLEESSWFAEEYPEFMVAPDSDDALARRKELYDLWQTRAKAIYDRLSETETEAGESHSPGWSEDTRAPKPDATSVLPNEGVSLAGPPDQNNASFAYHEGIVGEAYGVWTEHLGPYGLPPTQVWQSGTPAAGSGIPWPAAGTLFGPVIPLALPESWNPSIAAVPILPPMFDAFYMTMTEWPAPALTAGVPSVIVANSSVGSGAPFPSGTGPAMVFQAGPGTWVDYPYMVVDDVIGNPGPPGFGDVHIAWVEYIEGGDADANGNGNWFDDPADSYTIWAATANTGVGPSPYPGFIIQPVHPRPAVMPQAHQTHRPSLSVVGPSGTPPPVALPPGGVYLAYVDFISSSVIIDASPAPGLGAPWGVFGPFAIAPVVLLPPVLNGNIKAASSVSIAVDNGPLFPGQMYIAFADHGTGDADILFCLSSDGGANWSPPMRVNQDPLATGVDQWAPHMMVDPASGEICVTYFDRRNDPANNLLIETWSSCSMDGGLTWTDYMVSDVGPMPPISTLTAGLFAYIGDYLTSDYSPFSGWGAVWNDGRNGGDQDVLFENIRQPSAPDSDGDGHLDGIDNCTWVHNVNQAITITMCGDCNMSGTLTSSDVILMVNYTFKGGPAPQPCAATGDVNCDGSNTSSDIIYMVNHVFKGGPLPCNICQFPGLGWSCP